MVTTTEHLRVLVRWRLQRRGKRKIEGASRSWRLKFSGTLSGLRQ
jgi:hypothetical protein